MLMLCKVCKRPFFSEDYVLDEKNNPIHKACENSRIYKNVYKNRGMIYEWSIR